MSPVLALAAVAFGLPVVHPIERAEKVFVLSTAGNCLANDGRSRLVLGVWGDGYIVWSGDRVDGGPPYRAGRVDPKKVAAFFAKVEADDPFADETLRKTSSIIPDADYATLFLKSGKKTLDLDSVHELFENDNPRSVVRRGAAMGRDGEGRYALLKQDPRRFMFFRLVWSELRGGAANLIPAESRRVRGRIVTDGENSAWVEAPTPGGAIWPEDLPSFRSRGYKADPYLAAAAALQAVGREKAAVTLRTIAADPDHAETAIVLCRMLFTARPGGTFRPPAIGDPLMPGRADSKDWPRHPIELVDGVPFVVASWYDFDGERPEDYVSYCLRNCDWNTETFAPKCADQKRKALAKLLASPRWKGSLDPDEKDILAAQIR